MKKIAVLMTCYNRIDTTLECLRRLFAQEIPDGYSLDVWLVDDASPDKTGERVKTVYPQVNVIQGAGNLYWCKGMRLAWDKAAESYDYDFYLWLNDDVMLLDSVIVNLVKDIVLIEDANVYEYVISGPMATDASCISLCYGCYGRSGVFRPIGRPVDVDGTYSMSGNLVLIPRKVFEKLGPISNEYSHAYGDSDYRCKMKRFNIKLYCTSIICGVCPLQPERYVSLSSLGFKERLKALSNPKGYSLHDLFIFRYRNFGLMRAFLSMAHVVYKVIFKK